MISMAICSIWPVAQDSMFPALDLQYIILFRSCTTGHNGRSGSRSWSVQYVSLLLLLIPAINTAKITLPTNSRQNVPQKVGTVPKELKSYLVPWYRYRTLLLWWYPVAEVWGIFIPGRYFLGSFFVVSSSRTFDPPFSTFGMTLVIDWSSSFNRRVICIYDYSGWANVRYPVAMRWWNTCPYKKIDNTWYQVCFCIGTLLLV